MFRQPLRQMQGTRPPHVLILASELSPEGRVVLRVGKRMFQLVQTVDQGLGSILSTKVSETVCDAASDLHAGGFDLCDLRSGRNILNRCFDDWLYTSKYDRSLENMRSGHIPGCSPWRPVMSLANSCTFKALSPLAEHNHMASIAERHPIHHTEPRLVVQLTSKLQRANNLTSNDNTLRLATDFHKMLPGTDAKPNRKRQIRVLLDSLQHGFQIYGNGGTSTSNTERRDDVDEAVGYLGEVLDTGFSC